MNPAAHPIRGISSMATRAVLGELAGAYTQATGRGVEIESVGGVDAARRVQAGEAFDVVLLAADAIDKLIAGGALRAGSRVDLVLSPVALAVPAGAPRPDIGSEDAVKQAVLAAPTLGYSTGPSGNFLLRLFERWGIAEAMKSRLVQAPPGVPVGALLARGEVALGFQQLSELINVRGVDVLGTLPPAIEFITTFSAGVPVALAAERAAAVADLLAFLNTEQAAETKRRHGMAPA
jgi:molybdate transport system substrate-binding protein